MDMEGCVDGSFNTHFLKLTKREQERNLSIAKATAFTDRSTDIHGIEIFQADAGHPHKELIEKIIFNQSGQ